jgi:DNA polymerase-3 subunit gamma/tau
MSYLVIARKWRPKLFDEVVGQDHVTRTLKNAIASNRIAHAYIFSGPRGVGKTTVARILAKTLNCVNGPTSTPCNNCHACRDIAAGSSMDVLEIDGASNTSVDNVRELRENIRYMPSHGKYRIYIIDEVHMLSNSAFNALLKTLEEPPPHAIFIFATTEVHKVPATILSRCQRFDFKRIPFKEIQERLNLIARDEGIEIDEKGIYLIAREADGSLRDAQSFLDQVIAFANDEIEGSDVTVALGLMDRSLLYDLSEAVLNRDSKSCLNIIENIYNFGYDFKKLCIDILEHIRDLIVVKVVKDTEGMVDLPDSEVERLKELSLATDLPRLQIFFNIMARCHEEVSRSSSPRFVVEMALLKAAHIDDVQPLSTIIEGLNELEKELSGKVVSAVRVNPVSITDSKEKAGLVGFIKGKSRHLASCLESAKILVDGAEVNFSVKDSFYNYLIDNRNRLEDFCGEYFGTKMGINLKKFEKDESPKLNTTNSVVKEAVRIFGGKIIKRDSSRNTVSK